MSRRVQRAPIVRRAGCVAAGLFISANLLAAARAHAQAQITVTVSPDTRRIVQPGEKLALPIIVDLSAAGGQNLASLSANLGWGNRLTFDSLKAAPFGTVDFNTVNAASGAAAFGLYSPTGATSSFTTATLYMTVGSNSGSETISLTPTNAGNEAGATLLSIVRGRRLDVCISIGGKWGDVNNDGNVNIIDAQQIARYSIGLSVANVNTLLGRGEVNADAAINIIDAQQVARFSIGLSASVRINTNVSAAPVVSTLQAQPTLNLTPTTTAVVMATPQDAGGASLAGCVPVTWQSLTPTVATVDTTGAVTGVANGVAVVRATAGSQTADINVSVGPSSAVTCSSGGITYATQTYASPQTWTAASSPHIVSGTQTFNLGASLTIEAGALVCLNGGQGMTFRAGSKLVARGTPAQPIVFTATTGTNWSRIQLGDVGGYSGVSTDTSFITNALVERGGLAAIMLDAWPQHALVMDSVRVRASANGLVRLDGPGGRIIRSSVDTTTLGGGSTPVVFLGRGAIDLTPVRNGLRGAGIQLTSVGAAVRNVTVSGGVQGLFTTGGASDVQVTNVIVSQPTGVGVDFTSGTLSPLSTNLEVTGGASSPWRGSIGNFGILFPDSASQQKLKVNAVDTLYIAGGALQSGSTVVRPDLPWFITSTPTVDTLAQLIVRPGARLYFQQSGLAFSRGGTLNATGEASKVIRFQASAANVAFHGLQFNSPGPGVNPAAAPTAVSQLSYARLDSATGIGAGDTPFCCTAAINAANRHRLLIDSLIMRKPGTGGIWLAASGSVLSRTVVDTTGAVASGYTTNVSAVALDDSILVTSLLVRRSGSTGLHAYGTGVRLQNVRVVASLGTGIVANSGALSGDAGGVRADSANAIAYNGTIGNFVTLAPDSATQVNAFTPVSGPGNASNRVEITGSTLAGTPGTHTPAAPLVATAIPQLPWHVLGVITFDSLARFAPRPSAVLQFSNAGLAFQRGATLNALGTATKFIDMKPATGTVQFYGVVFHNPGPGPNPALAPMAVSQMAFVRVDSASSFSSPTSPFCCSATLNAGTKHRLSLDSVIVRKSYNGAIWLAAPGSSITRSVVDTTGNVGSGYTTTLSAVALNDSVTVNGLLVRRSGNIGLWASGLGARLQNVRVVASLGVGVQAHLSQLAGDAGGVRADSGNSVPFQGTIGNLTVLAPDSAAQANAFFPPGSAGNASNRLEIVGGTFAGTPGTHTEGSPLTVTAIPQLPWHVLGTITIDTLARLAPRPSATLRFSNAGLAFQRGGTLIATGGPGKLIRFQPLPATQFYGFVFHNPGPGPTPALAPVAVSQLAFAHIDSANAVGNPTSPFCCQSAITAGTKHRLLLDTVTLRKSFGGAIWLAAPGSQILRSVVDTTGNIGSGYTTSVAAVALGDSTLVNGLLVRRSGQAGIFASGLGVRLQNVRVVASLVGGVYATGAQLAGDPGGVRADSGNGFPFQGTIGNLAVLAPDSATQANAFFPPGSAGNVSNRLEIVGSTLAGTSGTHTEGAPLTVSAIPQLPWRVLATLTIDTLARLAPRPGATHDFSNAGLVFQRGGTFNATGEIGKLIQFRPVAGTQFFGFAFHNPGPGPIPALAPVSVSQMAFVRVDSANAVANPTSPFCCQSAITAGTKHRLLLDTVTVRKSFGGAIWLAAPLSSIARSVVDTTGNIGSGYTTNVSAVALGDSVTVNGLLVRRSGQAGIWASGLGVRLQNVRVVGSQLGGLYATSSQLVGDVGGVRADSGNAFPFQGTIGNLAVLAPDSASQANAFFPPGSAGNLSNRIEIVGSMLAGTPGTHSEGSPLTVTTIPQLPWHVLGAITVDTLARLAPRPGTTHNFSNAGYVLQRGGVLTANGAVGKIIQFRPLASNVQFWGFVFHNPGAGPIPALAPVSESQISFARIDSAYYMGNPVSVFCCVASVHAGTRHRVLMDTVVVRKSYGGAVWLNAPGSQLLRSVVDTTGDAGTGYVTNVHAVALNDSATATNLLVRRSGAGGLYIDGAGISITGARIVNSRLNGIDIVNNALAASGGSNGLALSGFTVDSTQVGGVGVAISASNVQLSSCKVRDGMNHGVTTTSSYSGVQIANCNILNNGRNGTGLGVSSGNTSNATYLINAVNNFWGLDLSLNPITPAVDGVNGVSANITFAPVRTTPIP